MRMTLDFGNARTTACHCYVGVGARIGEGAETIVTIAPDGCRIGTQPGATLPCVEPEIDNTQAWSVAVLLTGDERNEPGVGAWDSERRTITYPLGARRRVMMG